MDTNNPVVKGTITATALVALFKALLLAFQAMNWFGLTPDQMSAWVNVAETGFPIAVIVVTGWWTNRKTTPLAEPTDIDGVRLTRPDNSPALEERKTIAKEVFRERKA